MIVLGLACGLSELDDDFVPRMPIWFGHDAAAVLVRDGEVLSAVEEERLNRLKHTAKFSHQSIRAVLKQTGLRAADIDQIAFHFTEEDTDKQLGLLTLEHPTLPWRSSRSILTERLSESLETAVDPAMIRFVRHHTSHGFSAYYNSGLDDALVVVMDGQGDYESVSLISAEGDRFETLRTFPEGHSLGHLYERVIELLAYKSFDEYKVMGLAPHGDPSRYRAAFRQLYELHGDGGYQLEYSEARLHLLRSGFVPRRKGEPFTQAHKDLAAALQESLEEISIHVITHAQKQTGHRALCMSGGVGLNCTMNGKLMRSGLFARTFFDPAAHDAGSAIGAAMFVCQTDEPQRFQPSPLKHLYWGPVPSADEPLAQTLARWAPLLEISSSDDIFELAATALAEGAIVGWVRGHSEFGPRALGNRSILADPRPRSNMDRINAAVKKREGYRPFAPSVLKEAAHTYFEIPDCAPALDYMIAIVDVKPEYRSLLGAITHVDGTARIQTVDRETNEPYWRVIAAFGRLTGVPVLLNTSFNNHAEPIVQTAEDAIVCFLTTDLDYLALDDWFIAKKAFAAQAYLGLVPALPGPARLCSWQRIVTASGEILTGHEISYHQVTGSTAQISAAAFEVLSGANGERSLDDLGVDPYGSVLPELIALWDQRLIVLRPPASG